MDKESNIIKKQSIAKNEKYVIYLDGDDSVRGSRAYPSRYYIDENYQVEGVYGGLN